MKYCLSIVYFIFFFVYLLPAQELEVGLFTGLTYYEGELSPILKEDLHEQMVLHYGAFVNAPVFKWLSFALGATTTELKLDGSLASFHHNIKIKTPLHELYWQASFKPIRFYLFNKSVQINPFIGSGVIFLHYIPYGWYQGKWLDLRDLGTAGQGLVGFADKYPRWAFAIPLFYGIQFNWKQRIQMTIEIRLRYPFTDYLDDIGFNRVKPLEILEKRGPIAAFFANSLYFDKEENIPDYFRRGTKRMDYYHTLSMGITFSLGKRKNTEPPYCWY